MRVSDVRIAVEAPHPVRTKNINYLALIQLLALFCIALHPFMYNYFTYHT